MMNKAQLLLTIQLILFALLGGATILLPTSKTAIQWVIGISITLIGIAIALLAFREHSRVNQSGPKALPTPNQQADLITSGLYQRIRHPIYTGVLLVALGVTVWHGHIVTLIASLLLLGLLTYKSMYEEELLREQYPNYAVYMQTTGRFLPKLF